MIKPRLIHKIARGFAKEPAPQTMYGDSCWWEAPNLWEPSVLMAVKDLVKPGDTVFDVGANFGGITSAMARLVGPRGTVCAFEASPRIVGYLQRNIIHNGHRNVTVYNRAVYSSSNHMLNLFAGDHLNDSLYVESGSSQQVKSLALDDFCDATQLVPKLIKADVEGAEYDTLLGAARLIKNHRPYLLLEQDTEDRKCLDFLEQQDYAALDLGSYNSVSSTSYYTSGHRLRNTLFFPQEKIHDLPYALPVARREMMRIPAQSFHKNLVGSRHSDTFMLDAGRYFAHVDFEAESTTADLMCGIRLSDKDILRYHAFPKQIARYYRNWIFDIPASGPCQIYFNFLNGTSDPTFSIKDVKIEMWENFQPPLWPTLVME